MVTPQALLPLDCGREQVGSSLPAGSLEDPQASSEFPGRGAPHHSLHLNPSDLKNASSLPRKCIFPSAPPQQHLSKVLAHQSLTQHPAPLDSVAMSTIPAPAPSGTPAVLLHPP